MNATERMMLHLLDCALEEKAPDPALADDINWTEMFQLAQEHKIDALLLDAICQLPENIQPEGNILAAWQENAMLTMMGQAILTDQLHQMLAALEEAGIKAVVLKGIVLKALYPQPDLRTMSDADLLVQAQQTDAARAVLQAQGCALVEEEPGVYIYNTSGGLRMELHAHLFDKKAYGFLSKLDEETMFPVSLARREAVYGGEAWAFPPMQHMLFMLCHMAKHMISTGFGLRQTADIILYTRANDEIMDWDAFWKQAGELGLDAFASAILGIGTAYLSLPQGRWAQGARQNPQAADALLEDLFDAGVFGHRTEERKRSAAIVYRAFDAPDGDSGRIRRAIFPSAGSLKAPYLYAQRHPTLLPIAWVHRWINYGLGVLTGKNRHANTVASIQVADERLQLLDQLGLRGEDHG